MNDELQQQAFEAEMRAAQKERAYERSRILMRLQKAGFTTDQAHALIQLFWEKRDE